MKSLLIFCLLIGISLGAPVEGPGKINDLPTLDPYQPEKPPVVPIKLGHRSKFDYKPFLGEVLYGLRHLEHLSLDCLNS